MRHTTKTDTSTPSSCVTHDDCGECAPCRETDTWPTPPEQRVACPPLSRDGGEQR